ncbi:MAG: diguanylate cyclase, partial [Ilumatobacteraceae bacterium]
MSVVTRELEPEGLASTVVVDRRLSLARIEAELVEFPEVVNEPDDLPTTLAEALARLETAEDTLRAARAALAMQATHDVLTGLPNRGLLVERITGALLRARRSRGRTAVLFVDLDGFKQINDSHGHAAGDSVLRRVAEQLSAVVRPHDTVARIGSDEFVVLASGVENRAQAVEIGARLVAELGRRLGDADHVGASVGVSLSIRGRGSAEVLLNEAEKAMVQAKSLGGRRVAVFDTALGRKVLRRSSSQTMLQSALNEHRVIAYYQPIVDLVTGRVVGFEALARIAGSDGSILSPAEFISVADDSGLVVPLGTQILELACAEAQRWGPVRLPTAPLTIAVNLSARQFEPGNLTTVVQEMLQQTGLEAAHLHLELTETMVIDLRPDLL